MDDLKWRLIEEAPDGALFIVCAPFEEPAVVCRTGNGEWHAPAGRFLSEHTLLWYKPTHWMPLPPPPEEKA